MKVSIRQAFVVSSILHALCFISVVNHGGKGGAPQTGDPTKKESGLPPDDLDGKHIVEKPTEVTLVEQPAHKDKGPGKKKESKKKSTCKLFFGGIGVLYANGRGEVYEAYPGYPAANAGIQAGDVILNAGNIRGEPGSVVQVEVLRGQLNLTFDVTRAKICLEGDNAPQ